MRFTRTSVAGAVAVLWVVLWTSPTSAATPEPDAGAVLSGTGRGTDLLPAGVTQASPVAAAPFDFDGNGLADLAMGVPKEEVDGVPDVGVVHVLYSDGQGVQAAGDDLWHQDVEGVPGAPEPGDHFGAALASADFDGDGFADLAVGVGDEALGDVSRAGAVTVLHGTSAGLSTQRTTSLSQDSPGMPGAAEEADRFGQKLATGDFDRDGFADLAVGIFHEDVGQIQDAGAIEIVYGSERGLRPDRAVAISQQTPGVPGAGEVSDLLGGALAVGDVDADGYDDLAVGAPLEGLRGGVRGGGAILLRGGPGGVSAEGSRFWSQNSPGVKGVAEAACPIHPDSGTCQQSYGDGFAGTLAMGDVNDDGYSDLAVGVPLEVIGEPAADAAWPYHSGAVQVLLGSTTGLTATGDQLVPAQERASSSATGSRFGNALAAGDFDDDGTTDLAIGAPFQRLQPDGDVRGAVWLMRGSGGGLQAPDGPLVPASGRTFGTALMSRDLGRSAADDLVVSDPWHDVGGQRAAGGIAVAYGGSGPLHAAALQWWTQDTAGVKDRAEADDQLRTVGSEGCFSVYDDSCATQYWQPEPAAVSDPSAVARGLPLPGAPSERQR